MKWLDYDVKTSDNNSNFYPDYLGDICKIPTDRTFDMVVSFECFQHMPYEDLKKQLKSFTSFKTICFYFIGILLSNGFFI